VLFSRKNRPIRMLLFGSIGSVIVSFLLGLMLTPRSVRWQEGDMRVIPLSETAYWFNVIGITAWGAILGMMATSLLFVVVSGWKGGRGG
jgi:hypothetical protein